MDNLIRIKLVKIDTSEISEVSISYNSINNNKRVIILQCYSSVKHNFEAGDFFACLIKLRDWLWKKENAYPMIKGALINVYPSRMSRQMSSGLSAYFFEIRGTSQRRGYYKHF